MRELVAAIIFAAVLVFLAVYWASEHQAIYAMPMVQASEADGSRLYALCPTIVPWQAPKYVKEHRA